MRKTSQPCDTPNRCLERPGLKEKKQDQNHQKGQCPRLSVSHSVSHLLGRCCLEDVGCILQTAVNNQQTDKGKVGVWGEEEYSDENGKATWPRRDKGASPAEGLAGLEVRQRPLVLNLGCSLGSPGEL